MLKDKLALVPTNPGCYLMKDKNNNIIYVGKAKNLKNRLKSYFNGSHTGKTEALVSNICDFEYIITANEVESLILEINLIKKYSPKYNILLKDDKTYPYIELTNEKYPRLKIIRTKNVKGNKNKLYGPYPSVLSARKTVELINRLYPLRKCNNLKSNLCLYYHIGECLGYCKNEISQDVIDNMLKEIDHFLMGDSKIISTKIKEEMQKASDNLNFEKALELKNVLYDIDKTLTKQIIDSNHKYNFDCFGYYYHDDSLSIQTLFIRNGVIFGRFYNIYDNVYDKDDFLLRYIIDFYDKFELPKAIVVPGDVDKNILESYFNINVSSPQRGDIVKILNMANNNAKMLYDEKIELIKKDNLSLATAENDLKEILGVSQLNRIEIFDNSHLFGTYYVGGVVVFDQFKPNRKEYRKYKISLEHKDDLSAMKEVIYRRYYRLLIEDGTLPDLIIVDGGELQVNAAKEVCDSLNLNFKIIGLKKDDSHRTNIIVLDDLKEVYIKDKRDLYIHLSKMQEEVHRFAITYHRDIKSKGALSSILDNIDGIGDKRKKELLKKYKTIDNMKKATKEELAELLPSKVALNFYNYLRSETDE